MKSTTHSYREALQSEVNTILEYSKVPNCEGLSKEDALQCLYHPDYFVIRPKNEEFNIMRTLSSLFVFR